MSLPPLLASSAYPGIRAQFGVFLVHRCTVQRYANGTVDSEGNTPQVPNGAPETDVPCSLGSVKRAVRDEGGVTIVVVPTLMVSANAPLEIGSQISAVTDQIGVVKEAGPLRVECEGEDTSGLGASFVLFYELRGATVAN